MKRSLIIIAILLLCAPVFALPRLQITGGVFMSAAEPKRFPVDYMRIGLSDKILSIGDKGAVYNATFAKFGEHRGLQVNGVGSHNIYFPSAPTGIPGQGRIGLVLGTDLTSVDQGNPVTYWTATMGLLYYHDMSSGVAWWVAGWAEGSPDLFAPQAAAGLSIKIF